MLQRVGKFVTLSTSCRAVRLHTSHRQCKSIRTTTTTTTTTTGTQLRLCSTRTGSAGDGCCEAESPHSPLDSTWTKRRQQLSDQTHGGNDEGFQTKSHASNINKSLMGMHIISNDHGREDDSDILADSGNDRTPSYRKYLERSDRSQSVGLVDDSDELYSDFTPTELDRDEDDMESHSLTITNPVEGVEPPVSSEVYHAKMRSFKIDIRSTTSHTALLDFFVKQRRNLDISHYDDIVRMLHTFIITRFCTPQELRENRVFMELCAHLCKVANKFDAPQILTLVKFMVRVKLPHDSTMMVTMLQMLRCHFNEMSVKQILFLGHLLEDVRPSNISSALKLAVPIVLEAKLQGLPLPPDLLSKTLIVGVNLSVQAKSVAMAEKFLMRLYEHEDGIHETGPYIVCALISSLLAINRLWRKSGQRPAPKQDQADLLGKAQTLHIVRDVLLKEAMRLIVQDLDRLPLSALGKLVSSLSYAYSCGDVTAYSEPIMDGYATRVLKEESSIKNMSWTLQFMLKQTLLHEPLVERLFSKIEAMDVEDLHAEDVLAMAIIHAFASSQSLETRSHDQRSRVLEKLVSHPSIAKPNDDGNTNIALPYSRLGVDLCTLNFFKQDTMQHVIQKTVDGIREAKASSRKNSMFSPLKSQSFQLMRLWQSLQLLNDEPYSVEVDPAVLADCERVIREHACHVAERPTNMVRLLLLHALRSYDASCLVSGVYTKHFFSIDHLLVVGSDGLPVPQTLSGGVCVDALTIPVGAKLLAIQEIGRSFMLNGGSKPRSSLKLEHRLLVADGFTPVPLMMEHLLLNKRTDEEKAQYVSAALHQHQLYV